VMANVMPYTEMRKLTGTTTMRAVSTAICTFVVLLSGLCRANPLPPSHFPELDEAARIVIDTQGKEGREAFSRLVAKHGYRFRPEFRELIQRQFSTFEPLFLDAMAMSSTVDRPLHAEIRQHGSPQFQETACAFLRSRLLIPDTLLALDCEELAREARENRVGSEVRLCRNRFLLVAEVLSDYRDPQAIPRLASILDTLAASDCRDFWFADSLESPAWYLKLDATRIAQPDSTWIIRFTDEGALELSPITNRVTRVEVRHWKGGHAWHDIPLDDPLVTQILAQLVSSSYSPQTGGTHKVGPDVGELRITFAGGLRAILRGYPSDCPLFYTDNTRFSGTFHGLVNPDLGALVRSLSGCVDTDGF